MANDCLEIGSSDVLQDPWDELGDPGANAGEIGLRATDSPGYDASEEVSTIFATHLERTARIALKISRETPFARLRNFTSVLVFFFTLKNCNCIIVASNLKSFSTLSV